MLLQKYLQTISNINPNKIYVENVRSYFKVPTVVAKLMCEMAVVDNLFIKKVGIICKNSECNRLIASYNSYAEIPETITCEICENEEKEIFTFKTKDLEKVDFYQLKK
jgi:hypothetical protein